MYKKSPMKTYILQFLKDFEFRFREMVVSEAVESSNWPQSDPRYIQDQKRKKIMYISWHTA